VSIALGVSTTVAVLPHGDDPDTFAARMGDAAAHRLVDEAEALPTFVVGEAARLVDEAGEDVPMKLEAIRSIGWLFQLLGAGLERDLYLDLAAKKLGVERNALLREFKLHSVSAPP